MRLVAKPRSNRGFRAGHDVFKRWTVAVEPTHEGRYVGWFGVDRRVAEQPTKVWGQDRRETAGHRLQDVAPESLHPGRMVVIDKEIQLRQELARIYGPERHHLP